MRTTIFPRFSPRVFAPFAYYFYKYVKTILRPFLDVFGGRSIPRQGPCPEKPCKARLRGFYTFVKTREIPRDRARASCACARVCRRVRRRACVPVCACVGVRRRVCVPARERVRACACASKPRRKLFRNKACAPAPVVMRCGWGNSAPPQIHTVKNTQMLAIIKAVLATQENTLPQNSENVREIMRAVGVDLDLCTEVYDYENSCYLPRSYYRRHRPARRIISRVVYCMLVLAKKQDPAAACRLFIGGNQNPRTEDLAPAPLAERARARKLTPKARGYRTAIGIEIEGFAAMNRNELVTCLPIYANAVHDGSIRAPHGMSSAEVICLLNRDEMEPRLFRLCAALGKLGFGTNKSCGLHVHLDARHLSLDEVCARAKIINKWLAAMQELVPLSRRDNSYCGFGVSRTERYRAVNVTSHGKHGTLEIRLHSSTINYQKILAWIRLVELLFSIGKPPKFGLGCMATLETLPLAEYERAYWRARHVQLNPSQYAGGAIVTGNGGEE